MKPYNRGLGTFLNRAKSREIKGAIPSFVSRLAFCRHWKDVRKAADDLGVDLQSVPIYKQLAFQKLLENSCEIMILLQLLEELSLNDRGAQNLQSLIRWHLKQPHDESRTALLHEWLRRQISLGRLAGRELLALAQTASNLDNTSRIALENRGFLLTIAKGLSSSAVFTLGDIDTRTLNIILGSFSQHTLSIEMENFGLHVIQSLEISKLLEMMSGISSFLRSWILFHSLHQNPMGKLKDRLSMILNTMQRMPKDFVIPSIASMSIGLLSHLKSLSTNRSFFVQSLDTWWSLLVNHDIFKLLNHSDEWLQVERMLLQEDVIIVASYLQNFEDDEKCRFFLQTWFKPNGTQNSICSSLEFEKIQKRFNEDFRELPSLTSPFVIMIQILGGRIAVNGAKFQLLFHLLSELKMHRTMIALIDYFQEYGIAIDDNLIVEQIKKHAYTSPQVAFRLFKNSSLPLEACPAVAEIMIYNPRFNPNSALSYRQNRQAAPYGSYAYSRTPRETFHAKVELLKRMAVAYANSSFLFPNVAFRHVYRCYTLHRQFFLGPISGEMSRALTIAGIVRPLQEQQWVSTSRIAWILKIVRKVEGDEVATRMDELIYKWRGLVQRKTGQKVMKNFREVPWGRFEQIPANFTYPKRTRPRGPKLEGWILRGRKNGIV